MRKTNWGWPAKIFDQMRRRLQESVQAQQAYEQGRKELIAGISHDLSTPLTSIKGYVSGLLDGIANTPEKQEHYLKTIYHTACDMEHLVDSLFFVFQTRFGESAFSLGNCFGCRLLYGLYGRNQTEAAGKRYEVIVGNTHQLPVLCSYGSLTIWQSSI